MTKDEIAKEIVIALIEHNGLNFEEFPDAKNPVDLVCEAYKQIRKAINGED